MRLLDIDTKNTQKPIYVVVCKRYFIGYHKHAYIEPQCILTNRDEANQLAGLMSLEDNCPYIVVYYNRQEDKWQKV